MLSFPATKLCSYFLIGSNKSFDSCILNITRDMPYRVHYMTILSSEREATFDTRHAKPLVGEYHIPRPLIAHSDVPMR